MRKVDSIKTVLISGGWGDCAIDHAVAIAAKTGRIPCFIIHTVMGLGATYKHFA
jgi:hypothetical protein